MDNLNTSTYITSTLHNAPSIVMTMHPREQTIYLQLINKQKEEKK